MTMIDLAFDVLGTTLPIDHGYQLFAAITRFVPSLHGDRRIGIHPIRGRQAGHAILALTDHSRLRLRLPAEEIAHYLVVAGSDLDVGGHRLRVGIPRAEALTASSTLVSRLVTFRNALDTDSFLDHARRGLSELAIEAKPGLPPSGLSDKEKRDPRRILRIKDKRIVGYSLLVSELTPEESLRLQAHGLGGRRRMGCGVFVPASAELQRYVQE